MGWNQNKWKNELDGTLKKLSEDGLSASKIAAKLGVTRNTVIGRCSRRGYQLKGLGGPPMGNRNAAKNGTSIKSIKSVSIKSASNGHGAGATIRARKRREKAVPASVRTMYAERHNRIVEKFFSAPLPDTPPVDLLALEKHHCRWPVGDLPPFMYCGATTVEWPMPYCAHHTKLAWECHAPINGENYAGQNLQDRR